MPLLSTPTKKLSRKLPTSLTTPVFSLVLEFDCGLCRDSRHHFIKQKHVRYITILFCIPSLVLPILLKFPPIFPQFALCLCVPKNFASKISASLPLDINVNKQQRTSCINSFNNGIQPKSAANSKEWILRSQLISD